MPGEERVLTWQCPNGHEVVTTFDVEQLRSDLERGAASASCSQCGVTHTFSAETQADIKEWLDSDLGQSTCGLCGKELGDEEGGDVPFSTMRDADRAAVMKNLNAEAEADLTFVSLCEECFAKQ